MRGAALGAGAMLLSLASPAVAGDVVITITDLRSGEGVVRACMTTREEIFPKCRKDPASHRTVVKAGDSVTIRFTGVEPGAYAVALLHDENNDGKANRAFLGMMPKEGYGFSRDAKVRMGPPKFSDAVFEHTGEDQQLTIAMRYFL
jgi:uncharacterized protein (DUF2141 family)